MEELIPIVNELQDAAALFSGESTSLDLPQIAVVGNQSAGKSSVLENIVGKDFLPRGTGIVTRRPLILQLVHAPEGSSEYGEFLHRPGQSYTDYEAIRGEIAAETERVTGRGKGISASPISLRLYSPKLVNLTLVDLPEFLHRPGQSYTDYEAIRGEIAAETERVTGRGKGISASPISLRLYSPKLVNLTLVDLPEFLHRPGQSYTDYEAIRGEIAAETERVTGRGKGISASPISLRLYSPKLVNLTLVDLPEFLHRPGQSYTDYEAIRGEIAAETERVTGRGKGISASPISLRLYSPKLVNLTLVDLPEFLHRPGQSYTDYEAIRGEIAAETERVTGRGKGISASPISLRLYSPKLVNLTLVDLPKFLHRPGQSYTDYEAIRGEIAAETERVTGRGKGISTSPISLRLYSPKLVNLTLVDLPGMTKVPVGDQPADIELQIRAMITEFIARPNCLILAVSPANSDLATSDALQLAQSLDPAGTRTIGVLTKLDLMDHDTHAGEILRNQVIPLRFGYMAVVNRSQRDIEGRKNIDAAIDSEREFFSSHTVYGGTELREKCGTENLRKLLNLHLTRHIAAALPNLKQTLRARIHQLNEALAGWRSDFDYSDAQWRAKAAIRLAIAFAESFRVELLGNSDSQLNHQSLSSGAKIMLLFHRRFKEKILQTEWTQESLMKRQIGYAIENVKGVRPGMFTPDQAFDRIIREQIHHLREPIFEILDSVETEMVEAIGKSVDAGTLHRFPELASLIKGRARMAVGENADKARERITQLLSWENAYINTKHEDFVTFEAANTEASRRVQKRRNPGETVKKESWLYLNQGGLMKKKYWFVLTMDNILWYSDETKGDRIYMIPLSDNISFEDKGSNKFAIQGPSKNIYKASSFDEFEDWTRCLMQVGVFPVGDEGRGRSLRDKTTSGAILDGTSDADLERQIESLWILVGSYMTIICTTLMDVVPKCLVRSLIRDSVEWTATDLVTIVARLDSYEDLMEEDEGERQRKEEMEGSVGALSRALERLGSLDIPVAELPPPLHPTPMSALRPAPPKPVRVPKPPPKPRSQSQGAHQMGTVLAFPRDVTRKSSSGVKKEVAKALRTLDSTQKSKFY